MHFAKHNLSSHKDNEYEGLRTSSPYRLIVRQGLGTDFIRTDKLQRSTAEITHFLIIPCSLCPACSIESVIWSVPLIHTIYGIRQNKCILEILYINSVLPNIGETTYRNHRQPNSFPPPVYYLFYVI